MMSNRPYVFDAERDQVGAAVVAAHAGASALPQETDAEIDLGMIEPRRHFSALVRGQHTIPVGMHTGIVLPLNSSQAIFTSTAVLEPPPLASEEDDEEELAVGEEPITPEGYAAALMYYGATSVVSITQRDIPVSRRLV